jgi:hypothetical protein
MRLYNSIPNSEARRACYDEVQLGLGMEVSGPPISRRVAPHLRP